QWMQSLHPFGSPHGLIAFVGVVVAFAGVRGGLQLRHSGRICLVAITLSRLAVRSAMRIMLIAVCVVLIRVGMMSEPNPAALAIGVAIGGMSAMTSQAVCNVV